MEVEYSIKFIGVTTHKPHLKIHIHAVCILSGASWVTLQLTPFINILVGHNHLFNNSSNLG